MEMSNATGLAGFETANRLTPQQGMNTIANPNVATGGVYYPPVGGDANQEYLSWYKALQERAKKVQKLQDTAKVMKKPVSTTGLAEKDVTGKVEQAPVPAPPVFEAGKQETTLDVPPPPKSNKTWYMVGGVIVVLALGFVFRKKLGITK